MKHLLALALIVFSLPLLASLPEHDSHSLVVKMAPGVRVVDSPLYRSAQHLFADYYVLWTDHLNELELSLQDHPGIVSLSRNYKSPKRVLAKAAPLPALDMKALGAGPFNDPQVARQWTFKDSEQFGISINRAYANRTFPVQQEVIVAVVDTGVDYKHEDLKDVMWKNPGEVAANGIDDDQNGYIDDVYGINTLVRNSSGVATGNPLPAGEGHGTHVAGIIAAKQNNNLGVAGVSSHAKIMAIRTVPNNGDETDVNVAESFIYAAKHGAKVINCSFGKAKNEGGQMVADAIKFINDNYGTLVVAAAGNDGQSLEENPMYPAIFPNENLLVIASTSSNGTMSYFSNYSTVSVDVASPGAGILATLPGNSYGSLSGTSMASPNAAGVVAQVLATFPGLTPMQAKLAVMSSVTKVSNFRTLVLTSGRIDLEAALTAAAKL